MDTQRRRRSMRRTLSRKRAPRSALIARRQKTWRTEVRHKGKVKPRPELLLQREDAKSQLVHIGFDREGLRRVDQVIDECIRVAGGCNIQACDCAGKRPV